MKQFIKKNKFKKNRKDNMSSSEVLKFIEKQLDNDLNNSNLSTWNQGVNLYAKELINDFKENNSNEFALTLKHLLNGAKDWKQYSWDGNSLIYINDIAESLLLIQH